MFSKQTLKCNNDIIREQGPIARHPLLEPSHLLDHFPEVCRPLCGAHVVFRHPGVQGLALIFLELLNKCVFHLNKRLGLLCQGTYFSKER